MTSVAFKIPATATALQIYQRERERERIRNELQKHRCRIKWAVKYTHGQLINLTGQYSVDLGKEEKGDGVRF